MTRTRLAVNAKEKIGVDHVVNGGRRNPRLKQIFQKSPRAIWRPPYFDASGHNRGLGTGDPNYKCLARRKYILVDSSKERALP